MLKHFDKTSSSYIPKTGQAYFQMYFRRRTIGSFHGIALAIEALAVFQDNFRPVLSVIWRNLDDV